MGLKKFVFPLLLVVALSACEDRKDRAERYYQSALSLLESGDTDRAIIELKNVFDLMPEHHDARLAYADLARRLGRTEEAYSQYLRLVEQYPDDVDGRIALTEIALDQQNWPEVERHGLRVIALAPNLPFSEAIDVALRYQKVLAQNDPALRRATAAEAAALNVGTVPQAMLSFVQIDNAIRDGVPQEALTELDKILPQKPDDRLLNLMRYAILSEMDAPELIEDQLLSMIRRFPDEYQFVRLLTKFYDDRGETDKTEILFRDRYREDPTNLTNQQALLSFLLQVQGADAALAELDKMLAAGGDTVELQTLRANISYGVGDTVGAITQLRNLIDGSASSIQIRAAKVVLARILNDTGQRDEAKALVDSVLDEDPSEVDALKLRAAWMIAADQTDEAIGLLRTALDQRPRDPEALTLMSDAHVRSGNSELARDFLSLAAEASNWAPAESLRFSQTLLVDGRYLAAEETLIRSLRFQPDNIGLLAQLGQTYVAMRDWPRTQGVEQKLRELNNSNAEKTADVILAARLGGQNRTDEAIALLDTIAATTQDNRLSAQLTAFRARLSLGYTDDAVAYAKGLVNDEPADPDLKLMLAAGYFVSGDLDAARKVQDEILASNPTYEAAWVSAIRVEALRGADQAAKALLERALIVLPDSPNLLWAKAGNLEAAGDIEGAIALFERVYVIAPDNYVAANNLATLLSTGRTDVESLERAFVIVQRFRGTKVPQFQDTYGWIAYRRGDLPTSLEYLEPAAASLASDPIVQYHLGVVYRELRREADALEQMQKAVLLAGPADPRPQIVEAKAEIVRLARDPGN